MSPLNAFESLLLRAACSALSFRGRSSSLLVLIFHRVLQEADPLLAGDPDARTFATQMDLLRDLFNVLPLTEALECLSRRSLPPRAACVTFDDGYRNNREIAAPILAARGMTATFFIATGFLDGGRMFNDTVIECVRRAPQQLDLSHLGLGTHDLSDPQSRARVAEELPGKLKYLPPAQRLECAQAMAATVGLPLPDDLMMTSSQVRELINLGMEVGAHTVTHPILTRVNPEEARREIEQSRAALHELIGQPVRLFAYPNGRPGQDYAREHVELVQAAGFDFAVSTSWGCARRDSDRFQLPRIAPWDKTAARYAARIASTYISPRPVTV